MAVAVAHRVELDDPHSFCFGTAGLWTSRRLRPAPHWLTCQSAPMCTRTEWVPLLHAGKQMSAPASRKTQGEAGAGSILPAVAPFHWQDRSGWINSQNSHMIIRPAPCWILTLYGFKGFFFFSWCVSLSPSLSILQGPADSAGLRQLWASFCVKCGGELVAEAFKKSSLFSLYLFCIPLSI